MSSGTNNIDKLTSNRVVCHYKDVLVLYVVLEKPIDHDLVIWEKNQEKGDIPPYAPLKSMLILDCSFHPDCFCYTVGDDNVETAELNGANFLGDIEYQTPVGFLRTKELVDWIKLLGGEKMRIAGWIATLRNRVKHFGEDRVEAKQMLFLIGMMGTAVKCSCSYFSQRAVDILMLKALADVLVRIQLKSAAPAPPGEILCQISRSSDYSHLDFVCILSQEIEETLMFPVADFEGNVPDSVPFYADSLSGYLRAYYYDLKKPEHLTKLKEKLMSFRRG